MFSSSLISLAARKTRLSGISTELSSVKSDRPRALKLNLERVLEADRLEQTSQFVIAVVPLVQNAKIEIDLRKRRDRDFHGQ